VCVCPLCSSSRLSSSFTLHWSNLNTRLWVSESRADFWSTSSSPVSASDAIIGSSFGLVSEKLLRFDLSTITSALIELKIWRMRGLITDQMQGSFSFWNFAVLCERERRNFLSRPIKPFSVTCMILMLLFYDLLNCVSSAVESSCASSPGWSHDVVLLRMIVHNPDMFFGNLPVRSFLHEIFCSSSHLSCSPSCRFSFLCRNILCLDLFQIFWGRYLWELYNLGCSRVLKNQPHFMINSACWRYEDLVFGGFVVVC